MGKSYQEKVIFHKLLLVPMNIHFLKTSWYINYLNIVLDFFMSFSFLNYLLEKGKECKCEQCMCEENFNGKALSLLPNK